MHEIDEWPNENQNQYLHWNIETSIKPKLNEKLKTRINPPTPHLPLPLLPSTPHMYESNASSDIEPFPLNFFLFEETTEISRKLVINQLGMIDNERAAFQSSAAPQNISNNSNINSQHQFHCSFSFDSDSDAFGCSASKKKRKRKWGIEERMAIKCWLNGKVRMSSDFLKSRNRRKRWKNGCKTHILQG